MVFGTFMSPHNYTYQLFFDPKAQAFVSKNGGDDGIRTHDPLLAGQVLSQLSYTPITGFHWLFNFANGLKWTRTTDLTLIRRAL